MSTFVTDSDYQKVIGTTALAAISQTDADIRDAAELEAIEEISGYLRHKYDVDEIFNATGTNRNPQIVMITCDIALYHMSASLPQRMNSEVRYERYKRAIEWLEDVQNGKITPNLPTLTLSDGSGTGAVLRFGSQTPLTHNW